MSTSQIKPLLLFVFPALLTAILYFPVLSFGLVWDDIEWVHRVWAAKGNFSHWLIHAFSTETMGIYFRPLVLLSFYFDYQSAAPVFVWHLINYCLYIINIFLLGIIFFLLQQKKSWPEPASGTGLRYFSGVALLLFIALHPTQIETVAWLSCRFDLMSNTFLLLILLAEAAALPPRYRHVLQAVLFLLALFSKETAIVFLAILPILQHCMRTNKQQNLFASLQQNAASTAGLLISASLYLLAWYLVANTHDFNNRIHLNPLYSDFPSHVSLVFATIGYFAKTLAYPFLKLSPIYHHEGNIAYTDPGLWLGILIVATSLYALLYRKHFLAIIAVFFCAIFPFLNWSQISVMGDIIQNRYLSLPLLTGGLAIYLYLLNTPASIEWKKTALLVIPYLAFMAFTASSILPFWKNNISLWAWIVIENPRSPESRNNLASELIRFNETDAALIQLQESLAIRKNFWAYSNIAEIYWKKGDFSQANAYTMMSLDYPSVLEDKIRFALRMANRNLAVGNEDITKNLLQKLPTSNFLTETFREEYLDISQKLGINRYRQ